MCRSLRQFACGIAFVFCGAHAWATNITVQTNPDGAEDRITVLRGMADVLIKETQERVALKEGEELVVKRGGKTEKTEINVQQESAKWQEALTKLGDAIRLDEIPEVIRGLMQAQSASFKAVQDDYKQRSDSASNTPEQIAEFRKETERLAAQIQEDQLIIQALLGKVDRSLAAGGSPAQMASYRQLLAQVQRSSQGYLGEIGKMAKVEFRREPTPSDTAKSLAERLQATTADGDGIRRELSGKPGGLSQDWFRDAQEKASQELKELADLLVEIQAAIEKNPGDPALQSLARQVAGRQTETSRFLRDLAVVEVSASTLTQFQEIDDVLADAMLQLKQRIDLRNARAAEMTPEQLEQLDREILEAYERVSRLYQEAQRLYDSAMKAAAGQKYMTAELSELEEIYERIADTFQRAGPDVETLIGQLMEARRLALEVEAKSRTVAGGVLPQLQLVDDMVLPSPLGTYDYLAWGEWNTNNTVSYTARTDDYWIAGSLTPAAAIPVSGEATYSGQVLGKLNEAGLISNLDGTASLTANFENRALVGTFDNLNRNGVAWTSANVNATWGAGTNQISGTVATANQMNGTVTGNFFGPTANHVGGTWEVSGGGNSASGIFVANKQQPPTN